MQLESMCPTPTQHMSQQSKEYFSTLKEPNRTVSLIGDNLKATSMNWKLTATQTGLENVKDQTKL